MSRRLDHILVQKQASGLFEPDILLPEQFFFFFRRNSGFERERRLMLAVLEDAIDCYQKYAYATDPCERQLFNDAESWIFSHEDKWLFSFENICRIVDLCPDYIREGLARWRISRAQLVWD